MLFSTYKKVSIIGYAVVAVLVGGLLYLISPFLGIFFLVAMGLVALVFPLHFALVEARLDDHGGRIPMPYMGLGMWGVDIVDDGVDPNVTRPLGAGPGEAVNGPGLGSSAMYCPLCGASVRSTAKFCDQCGGRLFN